MKDIWIINEYAGSPHHGMEFRHYYLGREMVKSGYDVTIITAAYSHLFKHLPSVKGKFTIEEIDGIRYLWIKVPHYKSSTDKKRILKWFNFTFSLFRLPTHQLPKPDVIIVSPMQTMPVYPALRLCKRFNAKLIFEVKDIWPLSIIELGGYSTNHPFVKILEVFEALAIEKSNAIISVLSNYGEYLHDQGYNKKFIYIPNGVDLKESEKAEALDNSIKNMIPKNKFIVAYVGNIGIANALEYLIEAGKLLKDYQDILILIVGDGGEKEKLAHLAKGLDNIVFLNRVKKSQIQSLLSWVDICYIGLRKRELFKYGVSPNKIFDYMLAGKPIIHSIDTQYDIVALANCGISVPAENPKAIADAILSLYKMSEKDRFQLGKNGREYVMKNHNYEVLAKKLMKTIEDIGRYV
ncbi:MAG TPA: glycosyltransferase family 4 protein [bacterium]|nr:glycosyltransferase family 4 protein [bacterium]HOL35281.1 glycosyltransferase family 4 protein [bacterium]HPP08796.1 glycosyltransferase family 4 protein [bacterium]